MLNAHFDNIKSKLDKLNALSDSINSLEGQFDQTNSIFRETLKCSTDRLSTIAKTLGSKSIRRGRVYIEAKLSVEQILSQCQRACVQFEQANEDYRLAKKAIEEAEGKLRKILNPKKDDTKDCLYVDIIDPAQLKFDNLKLTDTDDIVSEQSGNNLHFVYCDDASTSSIEFPSTSSSSSSPTSSIPNDIITRSTIPVDESKPSYTTSAQSDTLSRTGNSNDYIETYTKGINQGQQEAYQINPSVSGAAKSSEDLNQAITRLDEAEKKRREKEREHLDYASQLMLAKENLLRLEREHGPSIRRSQLYFDEARQFNAKLNSIKADICRISKDILAAKKAYAQTLSELEQFSEDLHEKAESAVR